MSAEIRPLQADDLEPLSQFLCAGFHAVAGSPFAAVDVLRWKYLEARPGTMAERMPRSWVACDAQGAIVGHVGIWPTQLRVVRAGTLEQTVPTLHMLDWLGSAEHRGVGARLMRQVHGLVDTQYAFGGTAAGRQVVGRSGYQPMPEVPVFRRVLKPGFHLREGSVAGPLVKRAARTARDLGRRWVDRPGRPGLVVEVEPVPALGTEEDLRLTCLGMDLVFPGREAAELNALFAYPRGGITGWRVWEAGRPVGTAVLSVQPRGVIRAGKIADLFLERADVELWHAACLALTRELVRQQADEAVVCGSTPWAAEGFRRAGFRPAFGLQFQLRDRTAVLPRDLPYHLGFVEADYATLA